MDFKFIYKICTIEEWEKAKSEDKFFGSKKDLEDGYIHFSDKEQVKGTLSKFFSNRKNLILLKIETINLKNLIYETASDGNMFPHLYSFLDIVNVIDEYKILLDDNGSHILPLDF